MALLTDYSNLLQPEGDVASQAYAPKATSVATSGITPGGGALAPVPGAQQVTPALVNFNPRQLSGAYSGPNVPQDWQNIIASNPDYMQWSLGAGERADTATANRKAAMRALAIRFGGLPGNFSDVYGDIDPETASLAAANPESESNRLLRNYQQSVEGKRRELAARGMLQSGELDWTQGQLDLARQGDVYNLTNEFLDTAQGNINDYSSIVAGLNAEQIDQIRAAADRIAADRLYQVGVPTGGIPPRSDGTRTDGTTNTSTNASTPASTYGGTNPDYYISEALGRSGLSQEEQARAYNAYMAQFGYPGGGGAVDPNTGVRV